MNYEISQICYLLNWIVIICCRLILSFLPFIDEANA